MCSVCAGCQCPRLGVFNKQRAIYNKLILIYIANIEIYSVIFIEDIYFFEVNTKYISSSAVKKSEFFTSA